MDENIHSNSKLDSLIYTRKTIRKYHPYKMVLIFSLFGIATLFLGLTIAYFFSKGPDWQEIALPPVFIASTVLLLLSSGTMQISNYAFRKDHSELFRFSLMTTLVLTIGFIAFQVLGWQTLMQNGIDLQAHVAGSYLYLISGLHVLHVVVGMMFFIGFFFASNKSLSHPAVALVYFTDPVQKLRLNLLTIYWHFIDAIWIYLFLFFLLNNML